VDASSGTRRRWIVWTQVDFEASACRSTVYHTAADGCAMTIEHLVRPGDLLGIALAMSPVPP